MDNRTPIGRLADPLDFPGAKIGTGVVLYYEVEIDAGASIGDYTVIGVPAIEDLNESDTDLSTTRIGSGTRIGAHCVIHNGARLGTNVWVHDYCTIGTESNIGNDSRILYGAQIYHDVTIGSGCVIGGFCCDRAKIGDGSIMLGKLIHRQENPLENPGRDWDKNEEKSPVIESQSVVGFDALVIGGFVVHSKALVAAGAIVTKDVQPGIRVVGKEHYTKDEWNKIKRSEHDKD